LSLFHKHESIPCVHLAFDILGSGVLPKPIFGGDDVSKLLQPDTTLDSDQNIGVPNLLTESPILASSINDMDTTRNSSDSIKELDEVSLYELELEQLDTSKLIKARLANAMSQVQENFAIAGRLVNDIYECQPSDDNGDTIQAWDLPTSTTKGRFSLGKLLGRLFCCGLSKKQHNDPD